MLDRIGWWAMTPRSRKWHLIESEMGMDVMTRCGRRLHDPTAQQIRTHDTDAPLCVYCTEQRSK